MRAMFLACVAAVALAAAPAHAKQTCKPFEKDKSVCHVDYDPKNVLDVWVPLRSIIVFEFGKDEYNPGLVAADLSVLTFMPTGNLAIIKPKPAKADWKTQPILITTTLPDQHVRPYLIRFNLLDHADEAATTNLKVVYDYPLEAAAAAREAARARAAAWQEHKAKAILASAGTGALTGGGPKLDCDYVEQHDPDKPKPPFTPGPGDVCTDGQATYIKFPGNTPVPAVSVDGPDGQPMVQMMGFDSTMSAQVVHSTPQHIYLRHGDALVCIWKSGFAARDYNPGTGTSSKDVIRTLRGEPNQ